MVRLTCKGKNCNHEWRESKSQRESERVFCPKCATFHHTHSPMQKPPESLVYSDIPKTYKIPSEPLIPYVPKEMILKGLDGHTVKVVKA